MNRRSFWQVLVALFTAVTVGAKPRNPTDDGMRVSYVGMSAYDGRLHVTRHKIGQKKNWVCTIAVGNALSCSSSSSFSPHGVSLCVSYCRDVSKAIYDVRMDGLMLIVEYK